jgi:hypothetical protein
MVRNLRRRVEALEKAWTAELNNRQAIAEKALNGLQPATLELFISAFGAEREGRVLSGDESAAKQAYAKAVSNECHWAGYSSAAGFES